MCTLNTLIIGIGNMGTAHAACIGGGKIKGMHLYAVCDTDNDRLEFCKSNYSDAVLYSDWQEAVVDKNVDAVIIAVPHPLHADIAMFALNHGKHVLVEKPVDIRISKALELNRVADKTDRVFGIMFNQRTNNLYAKAREIVKSGELGDLKRSVWIITNWYRSQYYYDSGCWRATWAGEGGGVLLNQAPHNLDLWQWICGMPQSITAYCDTAKYHNIEVEDDVTILARYKNGATGTFITSTGEYPGTNRLEISGTLGKIVIENKKLMFWKLKKDEREVCFSDNTNSPKPEYDYFEYDYKNATAHAGILQNFTNAVLFGDELLADGREGINQLMITNAAYLSSFKNNCTLTLPVDENEYDSFLDERIKSSTINKSSVGSTPTGEYSTRWQTNW